MREYGRNAVFGIVTGIGVRRLSAVACMVCFGGVVSGSTALELDLRSAYHWDIVPARAWDLAAGCLFEPSSGFELGGRIEYLDVYQEPFHGIGELAGRMISPLGVMQWTTLHGRLAVDAEGGLDILDHGDTWPRGQLEIAANAPIPPNDIVKNVKLRPRAWYTHRTPMVASVENKIAFWGYEGALDVTLGKRITLSSSFVQEHFRPQEHVLDTNLMEPRTGGIPADTLDNNVKTSLSAYGYAEILKWLYAGYGYAWSDTKFDRWTATLTEPVSGGSGPRRPGAPPQPGGTRLLYAYYPYPTPLDEQVHLLIVEVAPPVGKTLRLKAKLALPVYSGKLMFYPPKTIYMGDHISNYTYETHKFAGPLTARLGLSFRVSERMSLDFRYDYLNVPYTEWAYFTPADRSYSYHVVEMKVSRQW